MTGAIRDQWAEWLLHRRHSVDPEALQQHLDRLSWVRDKVLRNAAVAAGETLLDVGSGGGLIAFGALEQVGEHGRVIFSDVSQDLLDHTREVAKDLAPIPDATVDVVTTRSALAYVGPKRRAFRVRPRAKARRSDLALRTGQPPPLPGAEHQFFGYDVTPLQELAEKVSAAYAARQSVADDPMFDYDERDPLTFAAEARFCERHLELHVDEIPQSPQNWETYAKSSPNPLAPTLDDAMNKTLTSSEADRFMAHLRPLVEKGSRNFKVAVAYLWGVKQANSM